MPDLTDRAPTQADRNVVREEVQMHAGNRAEEAQVCLGITRAELESIARRWISLWCAPVDWALFDRLHAEDFLDESSAGRAPTKAGFASGLAELVSAFPDLETSVDDLVVDEARSRVAVRWTARGTNRNRFLGIGPTGRLTVFRGMEIVEIRGARIVRRWGEWDISEHVQFRGHL